MPIPDKQKRATYHGIYQTLVSISQVRCQPSWGFVNGLVWPLAVRKIQGLELLVFFRGVLEPATSQRGMSAVFVSRCTGSNRCCALAYGGSTNNLHRHTDGLRGSARGLADWRTGGLDGLVVSNGFEERKDWCWGRPLPGILPKLLSIGVCMKENIQMECKELKGR